MQKFLTFYQKILICTEKTNYACCIFLWAYPEEILLQNYISIICLFKHPLKEWGRNIKKKKVSQHYQCYRGIGTKSRTSHISQTGAENALNKLHWPQPESLVPRGKYQLTISATVCWCFPALESLRGMEIRPKRTDTWRIPIKKLLLTTQMRNVFVGVQQLHKFHSGNICAISCNFSALIYN